MAGALLIAAYVYWYEPTRSQLTTNLLDTLRNLGIALFISIILLWLVNQFLETPLRNLLQKEIRDDVFSAVLGFVFPDAIKKQVEDHILHYPFFRRNFTVTVSLEHVPAQGYLNSQIVHTYDIEKRNESVTTYQLDSFLEIEVPEAPTPARFIEVEVVSGTARTTYLEAELRQFVDDSESGLLKLKLSVDMRDRQEARITLRSEQCQPVNNFSSWLMTYMTDTLRVIYSVPEDLEVQAFAAHPADDLFSTIDVGTGHVYLLAGGLLPLQGITVYWKPRVDNAQEVRDNVTEDAGKAQHDVLG